MKMLELDIYEDGEHPNGKYMISGPDDVYWCDNWAEMVITLKRTVSQIENMERLIPVAVIEIINKLLPVGFDNVKEDERVGSFINEVIEYSRSISTSFGVVFGGPISEGMWIEVNIAKYIKNENAPRDAYLCINGEFYQVRNP